MKGYFLHLLCLVAVIFGSCAKDFDTTTPEPAAPAWLAAKQAQPITHTQADYELAVLDFETATTPTQVTMLATDIMCNMLHIGRPVPDTVAYALARGELTTEQLQRIRSTYFYPHAERTVQNIRTRTVVNNTQRNYSTPGIYFHILTHLGTTCASGTNEAINYYTLGISATKLTFADANRAGQALNNNAALALTNFDPNQADFHYYTDTSTPVMYSGWAFEMVYDGSVTVDGTTYPGPFGTQDGSSTAYPYMFATSYNETFSTIDGEQIINFPLYDMLWYFPIQGLGAVYILGSDL